jgi:hypothetical protein
MPYLILSSKKVTGGDEKNSSRYAREECDQLIWQNKNRRKEK